jgi:hypothetical protein
MNNYLYTRLYGLKGIYYLMHARYADVLDKKIKTLQSTSLYHKLRPNYDNAVFWGIIRNRKNISLHANFLIIFLYDGFFLIFKVQEIVFLYSKDVLCKVLIFLSKTSAYLACIQDMYNERWTQTSCSLYLISIYLIRFKYNTLSFVWTIIYIHDYMV